MQFVLITNFNVILAVFFFLLIKKTDVAVKYLSTLSLNYELLILKFSQITHNLISRLCECAMSFLRCVFHPRVIYYFNLDLNRATLSRFHNRKQDIARKKLFVRRNMYTRQCRKMSVKAPRCSNRAGTRRCSGEKVSFPP